MVQSIKSQKKLSGLQVKVQEIQEKYKDDKETQAKELTAFYQKENINYLSGCLPLFIQLPILYALYQLFLKGFKPEAMINLYSFVPHPGTINPIFLGFLNLSQPNWLLALITGIGQYFQMKMVSPKEEKIKTKNSMDQFAQRTQNFTLYFLFGFTVILLLRLPAALALYWFAASLFSILQQYVILKNYDRPQ